MNSLTLHLQRHATSMAAAILVGLGYWCSQLPKVSEQETHQLASRFHFTKLPIATAPGHPMLKRVRQVHPSLEHISAWISSLGAAASLADLDGDGLSNDLIHVDPRTDLVTVAPIPGTGDRYAPFVLSAAPLPFDATTTAPMGTLVGDFNEDGLMDILVYYWGRTPVIFMQQASKASQSLSRDQFVATELTPSGERWYSNAAIQTDLDGDGHIDLVIGNYFPDGARILDSKATGVEELHAGKARAFNGGRKHLFLFQRQSSGQESIAPFAEVSNALSEEIAQGWTLAMGAADLDGDQLPEIYVSNDFGPDRLLHNRSTPGHLNFVALEGKRDFTTPKSCVLGQDSFKGMGCDFADINGDGLFDIYVSNIATKFGLTESHFLWESQGGVDSMKQGIAPYRQSSEALGLSRSGWGWDCRLVDFDNDGVLEAVQAVGFIKGEVNRWPELQALGTSNSRLVHDPRVWPRFKPGADLSGHELNPFFARSGSGRYQNIAEAVEFTEPMVSKGIAVADVDGDGRLDFVFANQWEPSFYFHNESPHAGAFLGLHLLLPVGNSMTSSLRARPGHPGSDLPGRPAFGATATLRCTNGRRQIAQVDGGSGHSGRRSPEIHFGLGDHASEHTVSVDLHWRDPQGQVQATTLNLKPGWHTILLGNSKPTLTAQLP